MPAPQHPAESFEHSLFGDPGGTGYEQDGPDLADMGYLSLPAEVQKATEAGLRYRACPFCDRIRAGEYESVPAGAGEPGVVWFGPLNPVVPGHRLVVPVRHVQDALADPDVTGRVFAAAARLAREAGQSCNLITSAGAAATQTVYHLHVHIVPRSESDGLALPWTGQARNWTVDPQTNRSNSSPEFLRLVDEVARLISGDKHLLVELHAERTAGLIMAQLAHRHGLAPASGTEAAADDAQRHQGASAPSGAGAGVAPGGQEGAQERSGLREGSR